MKLSIAATDSTGALQSLSKCVSLACLATVHRFCCQVCHQWQHVITGSALQPDRKPGLNQCKTRAEKCAVCASQTFCRKFLWHSLMLWPEDLPERAVILASCNDDLVPAELVQKQLKKAGSSAIMMLHPTHCHGGFLIDPVFQGELLGHISDLIHEPAKAKAA